MNRYKYLFKNIGLLTLSSFATKLLSFFLVPLYTNILTTTEYGTYDLINATIGVLLPILTLNIQESVLRFTIDNKYNRKAIVTVGVKYLLISNVIVLLGLGVNAVFGFNTAVKKYAAFFFLMFFAQSLSGIVMAYIRGIDSIADLSISSVIASVVTICFNILLLAVFKWGLVGYFLANILGPLMQCVYLIIKNHIVQDVSLNENFHGEKRAMVDYCKPMIANSVAWWVNSTSDHYVVIFFCGLAENGIYSVASKIPSILNIFQSIFNQAWTLSAVRDFDPEDKNSFFSNTYRAYNCMMVVVCSAIIMTDKLLAKVLYAKDFYFAWKYVPWLTIAIVFGAMSGYIGGFFSAVKDSEIFAKSSIAGAVTNVVLNLALTPRIGAHGAAIATTICYLEVWALRYWQSRKYITLQINFGMNLVTYLLLMVQAAMLLLLKKEVQIYVVEWILFICICLFYKDDFGMIVMKVARRVKIYVNNKNN